MVDWPTVVAMEMFIKSVLPVLPLSLSLYMKVSRWQTKCQGNIMIFIFF